MNMKQHILAAMREQLEAWEQLLAGLNAAELASPLVPSHWSVQDVLSHLWAWQQRSFARVEAARLDREPDFPKWPAGLDPDSDDDTEKTNAWIYESNRDKPWPTVYQNWSQGYRRLLESAEAIPEPELLASGKYPWLDGYPLSFILIASYDHHQEHLDKLRAWLREHGGQPTGA